MFREKARRFREIDPDEVFMDSVNLSGLDVNQMEGRMEKPISSKAFLGLGIFFLLVTLVFLSKMWSLQIVDGSQYRAFSENNRFQYVPIPAERGFIYSSDGKELAWNEIGEDKTLQRVYTEVKGSAHVVGYSKPPMKDSSGIYYRDSHEGVDGAEKYFNEILKGTNGLNFIERDAQGNIRSKNFIQGPIFGSNIELTINAEIQEALYNFIEETAEASGFRGGAGLLMDIETGELLSAVSFPEFDPTVLSSGGDGQAIQTFIEDERKPFLNRFAGGVFSPGSVVKPFVAVAALEEGLIRPSDRLESPAFISIPNPYDPARPSIFRDWRVHGSVDLHEAIAVSSNVYFYKVGGGYRDLEGLGITRIERYMRMFGFGSTTGGVFDEKTGNIPNPFWKQDNFSDGIWRVGDTYNTAIGQFGFQTTPIQLVRAVASLANGGYLVQPRIISGDPSIREKIEVQDENLSEVRDGMRLAVTNGTAAGLNMSTLSVAAKTGTAQTGVNNESMNSWITGFFPYEEPRYAFVVVMDGAPSGTLRGGVYVMRQLLDWMVANTPWYLNDEYEMDL